MTSTLRFVGPMLLLASCGAPYAVTGPDQASRNKTASEPSTMTTPPAPTGMGAPAPTGMGAPARMGMSAPSPTASVTAVVPTPPLASALPSAPPVAAETIQARFEREIELAKKGMASTVAMRIWRCGASCTCPPPCLEVVHPDLPTTWVEVLDREGKPLKVADWTSADVVGTFTGKTSKRKGPSPESYTVVQFRLTEKATLRGVSMGPDFEDAEFNVLGKN